MSYNSYNYVGLIQPGSNADLSQLAELLKQRYANSKRQVLVESSADNIVVKIDQYQFNIFLKDSDDVLAESKEMAGDFSQDYAQRPINKSAIEACRRRFELGGEEDYNMDYFNDSLYILECMEKLQGVTILTLN